MSAFGWQYPIKDKGWAETRWHLEQVSWAPGQADHMFELMDSVTSSGADELLAVSTSMHDLLVAPRPLPEGAIDILRVYAPSHPNLADGVVRMAFIGVDSRSSEIERPVAETLRLFWRFLDVEFGIKRGPSKSAE